MLSRAVLVMLIGTVGPMVAAPALGLAPAGAPMPRLAMAPPLVVNPPVVNLGVLRPGQSGSASVMLTNAGTAPLRILRSLTTCACTAADLADTTLAPGASVQFTGSMTPKSGLGEKLERITIVVEGYEAPVRIDVKAEVSLPVRVTPPHLDATGSLTGVVALASADGKPFRVLAVAGRKPAFVDFYPATDEPRARYELRWDLSGHDQRTMPGWWVIETDHPQAPIIDARVRHEWTKTPHPPGRPWIPSEQRIIVGCLKVGQSFEFTTKLQFPRPMRAGQLEPKPATSVVVNSRSSQFDAELIGTEVRTLERQVDLHCTIRVTARPGPHGPSGLIYGPLTYSTPDGFSDTLTIIGRLVE